MANLGSDVSQLFSYLEKNDARLAQAAASRACAIIEELLRLPDIRGGAEEVEILRDIIEDAARGARRFEVSRAELEDYFVPFALRVLSGHAIF